MPNLLRVSLIILLLSSHARAQSLVVQGKVTDVSDGASLPGVNILVKGTSIGTVTNSEGNFSITVPSAESILVVSFVGYKTQEVPVQGRSTIAISLEADLVSLEEVVVVGYGAVKKSDLTGSVSSIRGKDITTVPAINPLQSLQGKVPGLQVASSSGAPGAGPM